MDRRSYYEEMTDAQLMNCVKTLNIAYMSNTSRAAIIDMLVVLDTISDRYTDKELQPLDESVDRIEVVKAGLDRRDKELSETIKSIKDAKSNNNYGVYESDTGLEIYPYVESDTRHGIAVYVGGKEECKHYVKNNKEEHKGRRFSESAISDRISDRWRAAMLSKQLE